MLTDRKWALLEKLIDKQTGAHREWEGHKIIAIHIERLWQMIEQEATSER